MSPHCFELPFLFGNRDQWLDAPMLKAIDNATFEKTGKEFRSAIAAFVKDGKPIAARVLHGQRSILHSRHSTR